MHRSSSDNTHISMPDFSELPLLQRIGSNTRRNSAPRPRRLSSTAVGISRASICSLASAACACKSWSAASLHPSLYTALVFCEEEHHRRQRSDDTEQASASPLLLPSPVFFPAASPRIHLPVLRTLVSRAAGQLKVLDFSRLRWTCISTLDIIDALRSAGAGYEEGRLTRICIDGICRDQDDDLCFGHLRQLCQFLAADCGELTFSGTPPKHGTLQGAAGGRGGDSNVVPPLSRAFAAPAAFSFEKYAPAGAAAEQVLPERFPGFCAGIPPKKTTFGTPVINWRRTGVAHALAATATFVKNAADERPSVRTATRRFCGSAGSSWSADDMSVSGATSARRRSWTRRRRARPPAY